MVVFLFNSVFYISLLLCLCILILCLCIFIVMYVLYSVSLCCFVYCLCVNMHLQLPPGLNQITVHKIYHYININNLLAYGNKVWINHMARSDALKEETLDSSRKNSNPVSSVL